MELIVCILMGGVVLWLVGHELIDFYFEKKGEFVKKHFDIYEDVP